MTSGVAVGMLVISGRGRADALRCEPRRFREELKAECDRVKKVVELPDQEAAQLEDFRASRIRWVVSPGFRCHIEELSGRDPPAV